MRKRCPSCRRRRDNSAFAKDRTKKSGLQTLCRDCLRTLRKKRRKHDQEVQRRWRSKNADRAKELCRTYHHRHRTKRLKVMKRWFKKNGAAAVARWRAKYPAKHKAVTQRRRARKKNAPGHFTAAEWQERCEQFGHKCAYCRKRRKLTVHHVKALAKGGSNYISNIVPACGSCNSSIHTREIWPLEVSHL